MNQILDHNAEELLYESLLLKKCGRYIQTVDQNTIEPLFPRRKRKTHQNTDLQISDTKREKAMCKSITESKPSSTRRESLSDCSINFMSSSDQRRCHRASSEEIIFLSDKARDTSVPTLDNQEETRVNKESKKAWECPICLEPSNGQEIVTTVCGHIFCKKCLESYSDVNVKKNNMKCPTCRYNLMNTKFITLYNI